MSIPVKFIQVEYFTNKDDLNEWLKKEPGYSTFRINTVGVTKGIVYIAQYYIDNPHYENDLPFK